MQEIVATLYEFSSLLGTFSTRSPMPTPRYRFAAAALDGKIYITGGFNASDNVDLQPILKGTLIYDISTDSYTDLPDATPLTPRSDACMAAVAGKLCLVGGYDQDYVSTLSSAEVFDPLTQQWSAIDDDMPTPRGDLVCAALGASSTTGEGESLVVAGGYYDPTGKWTAGAFLTTVEAYNPGNSSWTTLTPMLHARGDKAMLAITGNRLMVLGGETTANGQDEVASNKVAIYYPEENIWLASPPMPFGRFRFGAALMDDLGVYAFGGATTSVCDGDGNCARRGGTETVLKFLTLEEKTDAYIFAPSE